MARFHAFQWLFESLYPESIRYLSLPGCTEHHLKLASVLAEARKKHKSLSVCWLDLANAYGSVHHSLP